MTTSTSITLHGTKLSGHAHRVELLLRMLGLRFDYVVAGANVRASDAFRRLNPLGQIPVLQDGGLALTDSNAILVYLCKRYATGSSWLPEDAAGAAAVQRWLSIAAGEVMYGPALARAHAQWGAPCDTVRSAAVAARLLDFMESHLATHVFLAASHATIADLACYSYVKHAPEGGISTSGYPALHAWFARVEALPAFVAMPSSPRPS